ncbi:hypothetical protein [Azospirillum doebereinerae]|uniref:Uncharacterized protein n=1 Tax=Azospirillum doebereinerae TaxID=92933 RepID=A0A3S1CF97_9PROT|nr:hypothetical protein [Azospirillum doebereinerae]RUQ67466.1 hypothetical protein EJ913_19785 [Azospirillum doebereinerae]
MPMFAGRNWTLADFQPFKYFENWTPFWGDVLTELDSRAEGIGEATAAAISAAEATLADRQTVAQDKAAVATDKTAMHTDRLAADADAAATAADRTAVAADKTAVHADRLAADTDAQATAADRLAVATDKTAVHADRVAADADAVATAADRLAVAADKATVVGDKQAVHDDRVAADAAAAQALAAAASVNLPAITVANAGQGLEVKPNGTGWQLATFLKALAGTATSWIRTVAGSAATPGLQVGEAGTGLYLVSAGVVALVLTGAVEVFRTAANGVASFGRAVVPKTVDAPWTSTITLDLTAGNKFRTTLGGATVYGNPTLTAAMIGQEFTIIPTQGTGNQTVSFSSLFKFPNGAAPTASTAAGKRDRVICEVVSTTAIDAVYIKGF